MYCIECGKTINNNKEIGEKTPEGYVCSECVEDRDEWEDTYNPNDSVPDKYKYIKDWT